MLYILPKISHIEKSIIHDIHIWRWWRPKMFWPKLVKIFMKPILNTVRPGWRCSVLLEDMTVRPILWSNPWKNFWGQLIKVNILINFDSSLDENQWRFRTTWGHARPDHHWGWLLWPQIRPLVNRAILNGDSKYPIILPIESSLNAKQPLG